MKLTDGINSIDAIEYERLTHIEVFSLNHKFVLKGPIEVRRGLFLLKKSNIEYLGEPPKIKLPTIISDNKN
jgi:hypothetical protein